MRIEYGVIGATRHVGPAADEQYAKHVGHGFSLVMIDWNGEKATGSVQMAGVAGRFELIFDSRQEAAEFFLRSQMGVAA